MMNFNFVCNYREQFPSLIDGKKVYNDHISYSALISLINTFNDCGYNATYFGGVDELIKCYHNKSTMPDGIYVNLNDGLYEKHKRGQTPLLLELLHVPFTGCSAFAALLASDKFFTKAALQNIGILSAPAALLRHNNDKIIDLDQLEFPVIVKPNNEGSSIGIDSKSYCATKDDAIQKARDVYIKYGDTLIEEYVPGYEATVLIISDKYTKRILLNEVLCLSLGKLSYFSTEIMGIEEKYSSAREYHLPEEFLSSSTIDIIKHTSEKIVRYLNLPNFVRLDFRVHNNKAYFLEINTNPAFGESSDVGNLCRLKNISFKQFVEIFIDSCLH